MKKNELLIVVSFLIIPLIICYILELSFLTTIIFSLLLGAVGLTLVNQSDLAKKLVATATTIGVFVGIGYTVSWFYNLLYIFVMMYIYATTKNIGEALVKILGSVLFLYLVKSWFDSNKEGMIVSGLTKVSDSLTARNCQDVCERSSNCRYSVVPLGTSLSNKKLTCWNGTGISQRVINTPFKYYDIWFNKKYKGPIVLSKTHSGALSSTGSQAKNIKWGSHILRNPIKPKSLTVSFVGRDQGWGNPTYGVYVTGYRNGKKVFGKVVKLPRTPHGVPVNVSTNWSLNTGSIDKVESEIYSRGSGHSFFAYNLKYELIGIQE